MVKIENMKIIQNFRDNVKGEWHGVYECEIDGDKKILVRHGNEVGAICYWVNEPVTKCITRVNKEVANEIIELVNTPINS